ncbi:MAG TPA: hypothetical protein VLV55_02620, partial [Rhizomicrobium sp.]|nr:hypothetical protein [Rhizomicrobium sp.]
LEIRSGTFKDGDGTLGNFVSNFQSVTVDAGANLVLTSGAFLGDLSGTGTISGSSGVELGIGGGDFGGVFSGNVNLVVNEATILTGDSTGVSHVAIGGAGDALALGDGGITGSVGSAPIEIDAGDSLLIDHSNAFALSNALSGSLTSVLEQLGTGTTTATHLTSFDGILDVVAGELFVNRTANNVHAVELDGGTLATGKGVTFSHNFSVTGDVTLAATTKTALTLDFSSWSFDASSITFGDDSHHGTIVWHTPAGGTGVADGDVFTVDIHAGVLEAADGNLGALLFPAVSTTVEGGAELNIGSVGTAIGNLLGSGVIVGSGNALLEVADGSFAGLIKGAVTVEVLGNFEISGVNTFSGQYELASSDATLTLDAAARQNITFFDPNDTIVFTLGNVYRGTVSQFDKAIDPTMDFAGLSFATATDSFANSVFTITDGTQTEHIAMAGTFSDASFALADDHHGGVAVTYTGVTDILGLG